MPKATYFKRTAEVEFYERYFQFAVSIWVDDLTKVMEKAQQLAELNGLNSLDALHLAAACIAGCDAFITTEKPEKPLYRVTEVQVKYLIP